MSLQQAKQEINLLKKELEVTLQIKNHAIIQLENALKKSEHARLHLENTLKTKDSQIRQLKQKLKGLQMFSRERSQALTHKNITIANLQQKFQDFTRESTSHFEAQIQKLRQIIQKQQQQINIYLHDHQHYLQTLEDFSLPMAKLTQENHLLLQFNNELQAQIKDVQATNVGLQEWMIKANQELLLQNEQGNDLLGQIQYVNETLVQ